MASNEVLIKHHKMTIQLQSSRIQEYRRRIQAYKISAARRAEQGRRISEKIGVAEGERGYLRGKIGVRIEEQRLTRSLNTLLEEDLIRLKQKLGQLKFLQNLLEK